MLKGLFCFSRLLHFSGPPPPKKRRSGRVCVLMALLTLLTLFQITLFPEHTFERFCSTACSEFPSPSCPPTTTFSFIWTEDQLAWVVPLLCYWCWMTVLFSSEICIHARGSFPPVEGSINVLLVHFCCPQISTDHVSQINVVFARSEKQIVAFPSSLLKSFPPSKNSTFDA